MNCVRVCIPCAAQQLRRRLRIYSSMGLLSAGKVLRAEVAAHADLLLGRGYVEDTHLLVSPVQPSTYGGGWLIRSQPG